MARTEAGGISSTAIFTKERENLLICWRNRVGLYGMFIAVCLCLMRLTVYEVAGFCGVDWDGVKSLWKRVPRICRARPEAAAGPLSQST
jgi:hypothetical protein